MTQNGSRWARAASITDVQEKSVVTAHVDGQALALFRVDGRVFAVDNRCPHMGFPLDRGTVDDCILTCHWHHARFDLKTGGTFDQWADDVRAFPVELRDGEVWVDLAPRADPRAYYRNRLHDGLQRSISLVIGKSAIPLVEIDGPVEPFRIGLEYGTANRQAGWGQGLTILTCMMNLIPALDREDRSRALFHGLSAVANDSAGSPVRHLIRPLPGADVDLATLKRWFRRFVEVRDSEGAERCIVTAVRARGDHRQVADMLFAAATDHRYISTGHPLDFTNKALEALDVAGWDKAEMVLASLASGYAGAGRMEESNAWRNPIDLVAILERAFEEIPTALAEGRGGARARDGREQLVPALLGEDPQASVDALISALRDGSKPADIAGVVAYAAALRIARFHTSNEFGDWDTALHTFTFANAVHQGLRRTDSADLVRGVFDAAMSIYLDRFLNIPPAKLPSSTVGKRAPESILAELPEMLNRQQQVNEAGTLAASYLAAGGTVAQLKAALGSMLLREDRDFHTIQCVEAAFRHHALLGDRPEAVYALVAAARYLAAHSPTVRAQGQTYRIASRLHRGELLYEEE